MHLGRFHKMEFIGSPDSDYSNFILLRKEKDCLSLLLNHLVKSCDWDLLELRDIPEGNVVANVRRAACESQTPRLELEMRTLCPYISLPATKEAFVNNLSRNMRKNLRKRMRKLRQEFEVEVKTQRDFGSVERAMEIFFKLHQRRWSSKGKAGAFASKDFGAFHLDVARIFEEKGWLALYFLTVDEEPIAAVYSFDYNKKKYGYLTGFDPDFGRYGVGNLLKMHIVEECIKNGFREYDLARDFEPYKAEWATGVRKNFVARMVRRGWFAKAYDWTMQRDFLKLLISKLRGHLTFETE